MPEVFGKYPAKEIQESFLKYDLLFLSVTADKLTGIGDALFTKIQDLSILEKCVWSFGWSKDSKDIKYPFAIHIEDVSGFELIELNL